MSLRSCALYAEVRLIKTEPIPQYHMLHHCIRCKTCRFSLSGRFPKSTMLLCKRLSAAEMRHMDERPASSARTRHSGMNGSTSSHWQALASDSHRDYGEQPGVVSLWTGAEMEMWARGSRRGGVSEEGSIKHIMLAFHRRASLVRSSCYNLCDTSESLLRKSWAN